MAEMNHRILLANRPDGAASLNNFHSVEVPLAPLTSGQVRVRNHFLSLDPYMRGMMNNSKSYTAPQELGEVMCGATAGVVTDSRNESWRTGDTVTGMFGWQTYGTSNGVGLRKVDATHIPLSAYLGVLAMTGVTAWYGLNRICLPKPGETVAVSAASGAVGGIVGQLAKRHVCRVIGIAGGAEKCRYVVEELGFDACVDYKKSALQSDLAAAAPGGIDGYFDNVGGTVLDAVMTRMNPHGRIAMCGAIAGYEGQKLIMANPALILISRLRVEGFIVGEHLGDWPIALAELGGLVASGTIRFRESIAVGLDSAPEAFLGLLAGRNFGKQLVRLI